jgi:hypothetical protein
MRETPAVTMETYTHLPSDLTRTALRRLGDQLEARVSNCRTLLPYFVPRYHKGLIPDRERALDLRFLRWS